MATATGQAAAVVAFRTAVSGAAIVSGAVVSTAPTTAATTNAADEPLAQAAQLVADFADLQSWLGFRKQKQTRLSSKRQTQKTTVHALHFC